MEKSEWSDKQLEELLQHMPKIKDRQDPDELYRKISSRIQDEQVRHSRNKTWLLPSVAAVAAIFLIILIGPQLMNHSTGSQDEASMEMQSMESDTAQEESESFATESQKSDMTSLTGESLPLIPSTLQNVSDDVTLITIGIPVGDSEHVVPVSMVSAQKELSTLQLLQKAITNISEEELGLTENGIFEGAVFEEDQQGRVIITFPQNFESLSSAQSLEVMSIIEQTFKWLGYNEAILRDLDGNPIVLGNYVIEDPITIREDIQKGYYVLNSRLGRPYLVPAVGEADSSFTDALEGMKLQRNDLQPSIPADVMITEISEENGITVVFAENAIMPDNPMHLLMVEAILLTAGEFGYNEVTFINTPDEMGGFIFKENGEPSPVPVPVAPNYIEFPIGK